MSCETGTGSSPTAKLESDSSDNDWLIDYLLDDGSESSGSEIPSESSPVSSPVVNPAVVNAHPQQPGMDTAGSSNPPPKKTRRPRAPRGEKPLPPPRQTAKVRELALSQAVGVSATPVETQILERIKKCLDRANHPNTPEMEAKAALRMSSRLMAAANITQADVLAQASTSQEQAQLGGQSSVWITPTKEENTVIFQTWVMDIGNAMETFFDCRSYTVRGPGAIEWVFYGIAQNTVAAATAFEMTHNLVLEWARARKGASKNSYCLGVGQGLYRIAAKEKREEARQAQEQEKAAQAQAEKEEEAQEKSRLDRLKVQPEEPDEDLKDILAEFGADTDSDDSNSSEEFENFLYGDGASSDDPGSDSDSDESDAKPTFLEANEQPIDLTADPIEEILKNIKKEDSENVALNSKVDAGGHGTTQIKTEEDQDDSTPLLQWKSSQQLVRFRESAQAVADEYLKSQNVKMRKGPKRKRTVRDSSAYNQGHRDSKKIDVRRKRIE